MLVAEQESKDAEYRKSAYRVQLEQQADAGKFETLAEENIKYKRLVDDYLDIGGEAEKELGKLTENREMLETENSRLKVLVDEYLTITQDLSEKQSLEASLWQEKSAKQESELRKQFETQQQKAVAKAQEAAEAAKIEAAATARRVAGILSKKREDAALTKAVAAEEAWAVVEAELKAEREGVVALEQEVKQLKLFVKQLKLFEAQKLEDADVSKEVKELTTKLSQAEAKVRMLVTASQAMERQRAHQAQANQAALEATQRDWEQRLAAAKAQEGVGRGAGGVEK